MFRIQGTKPCPQFGASGAMSWWHQWDKWQRPRALLKFKAGWTKPHLNMGGIPQTVVNHCKSAIKMVPPI
jgi:hypothetical protein